jgi:hypothetical protein
LIERNDFCHGVEIAPGEILRRFSRIPTRLEEPKQPEITPRRKVILVDKVETTKLSEPGI